MNQELNQLSQNLLSSLSLLLLFLELELLQLQLKPSWKLTNSTAVAGNMWAQSWENIFDIVKPFPNATGVDVTKSLVDQVSYHPIPGVVTIL